MARTPRSAELTLSSVGFRRDAAWLCAALWALAFLLLPGLHLCGHRLDHQHRPGGGLHTLGVELERAAVHRHGDGPAHGHGPAAPVHAPGAGAPEDPRAPSGLQDARTPRHGAGSPEHLAVMLLGGALLPPPPMPGPAVVPLCPALVGRIPPCHLLDHFFPRGPPAA